MPTGHPRIRMPADERRRRGRIAAQEKRDQDLAEKLRTAQKCPKRHGPGVCNGPLTTTLGTFGQSVVVCEWCERTRLGVCRYCSRPVAGALRKALYCAEHEHQVLRRQERASYDRHAEEYRRRDREKYWSNDERRQRNAEYKRLWRKANPDKVREQKKRYIARHRGTASSSYVKYQARYRKVFKLHRREIVKRLTARQRRPIPNCGKCSKPTGWTPVSPLHPGRPWLTCMKCAFPCERKQRRKVRRAAAKLIAKDPRFGLPAKPVKIKRPEHSPPRGPGDERLCITPGCDIVVTHRKKKCTKCRRRDAELAAQELAKTRGRGRRVDLERRSAA